MNKMTLATLALLIGALTVCGGTTPPVGGGNTAPEATTPFAAGSTKETVAKTFGDSTVTQTKSLSAASRIGRILYWFGHVEVGCDLQQISG